MRNALVSVQQIILFAITSAHIKQTPEQFQDIQNREASGQSRSEIEEVSHELLIAGQRDHSPKGRRILSSTKVLYGCITTHVDLIGSENGQLMDMTGPEEGTLF